MRTMITVQVIEGYYDDIAEVDIKDKARVRKAIFNGDGRLLRKEYLLSSGDWVVVESGGLLPDGSELDVELHQRSEK